MSFTDDYYKALEEEKKKLKKQVSLPNPVSSSQGRFSAVRKNLDPYRSIVGSAGRKTGTTTLKTDDSINYLDASNRLNSARYNVAQFDKSRLETLMKKSVDELTDEERLELIRNTSWGSKRMNKSESKIDLFQKGAFKDGYQLGDVTKTILGTAGDTVLEVVRGAANLGEGLADGATNYIIAPVADLFGADDFADRAREGSSYRLVDSLLETPDDFLENYSVFGKTIDAIGTGLGQLGAIAGTAGFGSAVGLGSAGTSALTLGTMGASAMGSGSADAYANGAVKGEAELYGLIAGASEVLTEMIFGGLGKGINSVGFNKGLSSADDILAKKLSNAFTSQIAKNWVEFGVKAGAEGVEEVLSGIGQALGKKLTYMSEEDLGKILADENLLEQFIIGTVTSGFAQANGLYIANKTNSDFVTGYNQDEQAVVDKVTESIIAEREEKSGSKLSNREKNEVAETARTLVEKGYVKAETIESILGGESYKAFRGEMDTFFGSDEFKAYKDAESSENAQIDELEAQIKELEEAPNTVGNAKKYDALQSQLEELRSHTKSKALKAQLDMSAAKLREMQSKLHDEVYARVKGSRLAESYRELYRRNEKFTADLSKYDNEYAKQTVQNILDSKLGDGTNQFRDTVDLLARISADHNEVIFSLTDTDGVKKAGHYKEGYHTNGYVTDDGKITLNYDSPNMLESIVGHEITHVLEKAGHYEALRKAIFDYAVTKEGQDKFNARLEAAREAYAGKKNTTPEGEVAADLIGEYLFTDYNFVSNLAKTDTNTFKKVWNEIKYLFKIATAGSKEARQLEKAKRMFEKAYSENLKGKVKTETKTESQYSLTAVEEVRPTSSEWHRTATTEEAMAKFPDMWNVAAEESDVRNPTQITTTVKSYRKIYEFLQNEGFNGTILDASSGLGYGTRAGIEEFGFDVEDIEPYPDKSYQPKYTDYSALDKKYDAIISNAVLNVLPQDQRDALVAKMGELLNDGGRMFINVRGKDVDSLAKTGKNIHLGDMEWIETVKGSYQKGFTKNELKAYLEDAFGDGFTVEKTNMFGAVSAIVTKDGGVRHSFTRDSDGNQLTKAQEEFFKDSKMRDADGNLKPMYHGTTNGGFHAFDHGYSDDDLSFFFVDDNGVASSYSGTSEVYEAKTMRSAEDMNKFLASIGQAEDYKVIEKDGEFVLLYFDDEVATSDTASGIYQEFCDYEGVGFGDVNYKVYLNLKNPLVVDADGRDWNALPSVNGDKTGYEYIKVIKVGDRVNEVTVEYAMFGDPAPVTETVDLYQKFEDNLADTLSNLAPGESVEGVYANPSTTRDYAKYAKENGYDGVIFENIYDIGGYGNNGAAEATVAIAFDSAQIKSTANANPTADPDIRYSYSSIANSFFGNESMNTKEFLEADYTKTQGYKDYVEQCLNNFRQSRGTNFDEVAARMSIEDSIRGIVDVAIASKQAGYDIFDDAQKRTTQDSKKRLLFSSLEPNSDYFTSNDISTICDKRQNFAEIYDEIVKREEAQGVPNGKRFFDNINNYFAIHKIMADKGLTTPCRQCYVESMRKNLAPMASAFMRLVSETNPDNTANDQLYHQTGKNKGNLKVNNASLREAVLSIFEENPQYPIRLEDLSIEMLTTEEGLARLRLQAPLVYEAFNSFYGQAKPKMPKSATPFRFGELTSLLTNDKGEINRRLVDLINSTGGFRLQSYSDFQIKNYVDVLQVLFEAGTLGLNGHAYTKVPAFLDATEGTNLKRNISIFMYKDGDEWKLDRNDSFPYTLEEIYKLVNDDKTGNTSIIAVSQNKEMSAWIMANDYVGYGIPFHKSGLKMSTVRDTVVYDEDGRAVKGYTGTIDHTKQQTEVWKDTVYDENGDIVHKKETKVKKGINIYGLWDFENKGNLSKNELIKKNLMAYIDACEDAGYLPKFRDYVMNNDKVLRDILKYSKELGFMGEDATIDDISFEYKGYRIPYGYYKFLGDFGMFTPDGKAAPQKTLSLESYDFEKAKEFFSDAESLRRNEILQQFANGTVRDGFRESDMETEDLEKLVKQKRSEVASEALGGKRSMTKETENSNPYGNYPAKDNRVYNPLDEFAPVRQDIAPKTDFAPAPATVSKTETVGEMFPDEPVSIERLYDRQEEIKNLLYSALDSGDPTVIDELSIEYETIREQIAELEADDAGRFDSIEDTDAPPETDIAPFERADVIPLTKKAAQDIARDIRQRLHLSNKQMRDVHALIEEYSQSEFPDREQLFRDIKEKFGTYTESEFDETVKEAKSYLRTYGLFVSDSIKNEIADYAHLMRKNRGRIRFSKEGTDVDVLYHELNELFPGLFPEDIIAPTDQFWQMIEVANMDAETTVEQQLPDEAVWDVANALADSVAEYQQTQREKTANRHGREAFDSLMQDADKYVPPVKINKIPDRRNPTGTENPDAPVAEIYDTQHKKGVVEGQQAMWNDPVPEKLTRKDLHAKRVAVIDSALREFGGLGEVLRKAKDLSTWSTVDNTPQRVFEKAFGYKEGQIISDLTVNAVAQSTTDGIRWLNNYLDPKSGVLAQISQKHKIKPGSKESAAAQMYAEGFYVSDSGAVIPYDDASLAADFPDVDTQKRIKGLARDPRIRQIYDATLAELNESRTRNLYPEIPRIENYYLHFRAMQDTFSQIGFPFNPNDIKAKDLPTDLNGMTADNKPGKPFFASELHRKGLRTTHDLLGGLERYLTSAMPQIYYIDHIQTLRALRNRIADIYGQSSDLSSLDDLSETEIQEFLKDKYDAHLSTMAKFLNEEANVLAGKTALIDRGLEGILGRRGITFLDSVNKQVGRNLVGYSASSAIVNLDSIARAFAKTNKGDFVTGFAKLVENRVKSIFGKGDTFAEDSPVIVRRKGAQRFYRKPFEKAVDAGYWGAGVFDDVATELIARTKYNEFLRKGMDSKQAHTETDKWVSRLMGDRSTGQQPHIFNSKMLGLITKFQLEVRNNLDSNFWDTIQESKVSNEHIENKLARNARTAAKITLTLVELAIAQHLFGKAFESMAGYNPTFDIIDVLIKAFGWDDEEEDEDTALDNVGEAFLALVDDLPYASTFTGGRIPIENALPIKQLINGTDQYGNEKPRWKTALEAAPYYLLPGGYGQIKKTFQGLSMFDDDLPIAGSYTKPTEENPNGKLRFPVEDTIGNRIQAGLFGQYASKNAREYFDNDIAPLGEKQIQEYIDVDLPIADYWKYREGLKDLSKQDEKIAYINGLGVTDEQKNVLKSYVFDEEGYARENPEKYAFLEEEGIGYLGWKQLDDETQESWSWAFKNQEEYRHYKANGVMPEDYRVYRIPMLDFEDEDNEAYTWAFDNPEKATFGKLFKDDVREYRKYTSDLSEIRADKDAYGKTISGSAKEKKKKYIFGLDIDMGAKFILYKQAYPSVDDYNNEIIEYLNYRDDLTYDDRIAILKELGFTVRNGRVYYD